MTYSLLQIEIIKAFGSKELSEGCLINIFHTDLVHREMGGDDYETIVSNCIIGKYISGFSDSIFDFYYDENIFNIKTFGECGETNSYEILGDIPELFPDVARVAKEKGWLFSYQSEKLTFYGLPGPHFIQYNPTLSLVDQEESTLVQLLNLFK